MGGDASGEGDDECDRDGDYGGSRTNRTHTLVLSRTSGTTAEQLAYRHTNSPAAFPVRKLGRSSSTNNTTAPTGKNPPANSPANAPASSPAN